MVHEHVREGPIFRTQRITYAIRISELTEKSFLDGNKNSQAVKLKHQV